VYYVTRLAGHLRCDSPLRWLCVRTVCRRVVCGCVVVPSDATSPSHAGPRCAAHNSVRALCDDLSTVRGTQPLRDRSTMALLRTCAGAACATSSRCATVCAACCRVRCMLLHDVCVCMVSVSLRPYHGDVLAADLFVFTTQAVCMQCLTLRTSRRHKRAALRSFASSMSRCAIDVFRTARTWPLRMCVLVRDRSCRDVTCCVRRGAGIRHPLCCDRDRRHYPIER
jgi:hypothetical protein